MTQRRYNFRVATLNMVTPKIVARLSAFVGLSVL
jgi:hypothetical protein